MSTLPTENYGSIDPEEPDNRRRSLGSFKEEVKTIAHSPLRLSDHAVNDTDRLHRAGSGTATIPSEVANMGETASS